jgi:hypothetical protein
MNSAIIMKNEKRRRIMEYKVISSSAWTTDTAIKVLEKKVNDLIKEGWEPIGGVMVVAFNDSVYQTLIKRDAAAN